jgi:hypothetical protein
MVMCQVKVYNTFLNYTSNGRISSDFELFDTLKFMVINLKYFMHAIKMSKISLCNMSFLFTFVMSQIDDHWQKELPKFGYRPYMIVKDYKNPFIFWLFA